MPKKELLTMELHVPLTPSQKKKIDKLADKDVLNTASFVRRHLVKTLKLKDDLK